MSVIFETWLTVMNFSIFSYFAHIIPIVYLYQNHIKLVTALYFFLNRGKVEKHQIGAISRMKLVKIKHFLRART